MAIHPEQHAPAATPEHGGRGPLAGTRVVEFGGIGPGPHCAMLLSDMGAEVLRIDRAGGTGWDNPVIDRGRHRIELDLAAPADLAVARQAIAGADVLIEGCRPGVMERLGLGPDEMLSLNPRLIYGRMTGWGQSGPLARTAGHDINYIAITGALDAISGDDGRPIPPLNLVGDLGGGSLYLAFGIAAALFERERSGKGQVIDAAIVDGVASMMAVFAGYMHTGALSLDKGRDMLGGSAPFYRCYACSDGKYISVGAIEPGFYSILLDMLGGHEELASGQLDHSTWAGGGKTLERAFASKTRDEWCRLFVGTDACVAPVLTYAESVAHPQMVGRSCYVEAGGLQQAGPAPRFSRTPGAISPGGKGEELLQRWAGAPGPLSGTSIGA